MKKVALLVTLMCLLLTSCNGKEVAVQEAEVKAIEVVEEKAVEEVIVAKETARIEYGRYYINGTVITNDGNEWGYSTKEISTKEPYDGIPVKIVFSDNGTTEIEDDIIKGLVFDKETAIYDELEKEMSEVAEWKVTRNGNEIRISVIEGNEND